MLDPDELSRGVRGTDLPTDSPVPTSHSPVARRVALNALNPFIAQVFTKLLMMGYLVVQYRLVGGGSNGPLGDYFLAGTLYLYTSTIAEWGLGTLLTREAAKSQDEEEVSSRIASLFTRTLSLRIFLSLLLFVPTILYIGLYTAFFNLTSDGAWSTLIISPSLLPGALSGSVTALLYARERMTLPALVGVATAVLNVALGIAALLLGWGVAGLAWAALLSTAATALIFWRLLRRDFPALASAVTRPETLRLPREEASPLLRAGLPLMLNALLVGLFFRADGFVIRASEGGLALEKYNAAYSFLSFVLLITPAITLALFPRMARHAESDRPRLLTEYRFALKILLLIAVPIVGLTVWFAPLLITLLTGGKEGYLPESSLALQILIFFLPLSFINGLTQYVLIALNRQSLLTGAFAATVVFNIAANLILVPLMGINGAALATIGSEWVLLSPFLYWLRREVGEPARLPALALKPAVAGAVLLAALWLLWPLATRWNLSWGDFALYVGAGFLLVALYALSLLVLRPLAPDELSRLRGVFRR